MGRIHELSRRAVLRSMGAVVTLPYLEALADEKPRRAPAEPARMVFMYLPFGVNISSWTPETTGRGYELSPTLEPLTPFKQDLSVLSGLQHIRGQDGGHRGTDLWLTGAQLHSPRGNYANTQSVDQLAAEHLGETYLSSLVLSAKGGVGNPFCSHTLSFNRMGAPIPAQSKPAEVFARLFPPHEKASRKQVVERFERKRSVLDMVLEEAHGLQRQLGTRDRRRLDEYLESVRSVEKRIQVKQEILEQPPRPLPAGTRVPVDGPMPDATTWVESMLDLIVLALRTDMTRVATFATGIDDANNGGLPVEWPEFQEVFELVGAKDRHNLAHMQKGRKQGKNNADGEALAQLDKWWTARFAHLLDELRRISLEEGTLLDRTMLVFGSSQSNTHSMTNMPIVLAGGSNLGIEHGKHLSYPIGKVPLSNLYLTMLQRGGIEVDSFCESTGTLTGLT